jgi:NAD(P)-dependent dehydrogenase (short-subunit alcohol dehydrogenase family)
MILQNKVALVTGGTSGIDRAMAIAIYNKSRRFGTDGIYESSRINCVW